MKNVGFPYGKETVFYEFSESELNGVLVSALHDYKPTASGIPLIKAAMDSPICSPRLSELAKG